MHRGLSLITTTFLRGMWPTRSSLQQADIEAASIIQKDDKGRIKKLEKNAGSAVSLNLDTPQTEQQRQEGGLN